MLATQTESGFGPCGTPATRGVSTLRRGPVPVAALAAVDGFLVFLLLRGEPREELHAAGRVRFLRDRHVVHDACARKSNNP